MEEIQRLKELVDLHGLASRLGLERPGGRGNYRSPKHDDKNPSLSVFADGKAWKDHSTGEGGSCIDLVKYVQGADTAEAVRLLCEWYGVGAGEHSPSASREKSLPEYIAGRCLEKARDAAGYLSGRGISEPVIENAIRSKTLGWNTWTSQKLSPGDPMYGGPAAAFITRSINPGHVVAVDLRYENPDLNGGLKTVCHGEKSGHPWASSWESVRRARVVYIVESPINALSVETAGIKGAAAVATRGVSAVGSIDWRFLRGKTAVVVMDNDDPGEDGRRPGPEAAWEINERLTALSAASLMADQGEWEHNDVNDILRDAGVDELRRVLRKLEPWAIPGLPGRDGKGRARVWLPPHDYAQYWRFRVREDFTSHVSRADPGDDGEERLRFEDVAGFRVASLSRVEVAGAVSVMTGEDDVSPRVSFAVSAQVPRHGPNLLRRVFADEDLSNVEKWKKFGPVFKPYLFSRLVTIWERAARIGERRVANFVGLAWLDGKPVVNEGPDCYFTDPEKQCPYHSLTFPSGPVHEARRVISAWQETFRKNAAATLLAWGLGSHLKAFLGFWPHMIMQADKGAGKSTLVKRLERTIAMTMFSGQSLGTEFRLLTSVSHTSHPVGWEELSARKQEVIDKAVALLQEGYQYSVTRRGSEMTEYLISASVLLAGEDVPVRSLLGKVVRTELTGRKGALLPHDLPRFPILEWLKFLAGLDRERALEGHARALEYLLARSRAPKEDTQAQRMSGNYAAVLFSWRLLCEFAGIDESRGGFIDDLVEEMNVHLAETVADREPWVWIMEIALSEIASGAFRHPYTWDRICDPETYESERCLIVRSSHVMDHIAHTMSLRDKWNMLPVKSDRVFKRQLMASGVVANDNVERTIDGKRLSRMLAISVERLERFGLDAPVEEPRPLGWAADGGGGDEIPF
ncbi:MAG: toprim domain-containing protein [Candidatus Nitrospinota bacterium M3_3B_026]